MYEILDSNGNVINRIVASQQFVEDNYEHFRFVATPEPDEIKTWNITKLAFKNRFPREKWKAAKAASVIDADVADFFESFNLATYIDLQRAETRQQVTNLTDPSVPESFRLTEEELDSVINTPARPDEIPLTT